MLKRKLSTRQILITFLILSLFLLTYKVQASIDDAQGSHFVVNYFPSGTALAFQNDVKKNVTLSITTGTLNSSDASLKIYSGGGHFKFASVNQTTIKIVYSVTNVKASGDQGNKLRHIPSGGSITVDAGDNVFIQWDMMLEPLLPLMFILGIIGLLGCFGGPIYTVYQVKREKYYDAFVNGLIITAVGIAFVLAWLW